MTPVTRIPLVAIVGRPNVGKSALFNRILRERRAIVESEPGVTRDRLYALGEWAGEPFTLVDTGGLDWEGETEIQAQTTRQAEMAIAEADLIIFVVDATRGVTPADEGVAEVLRKSRKPVLLAVNKVDDPGRADEAAEFFRLGLGAEVFPVSAYHGTGTGDLLDAVVAALPRSSTAVAATPGPPGSVGGSAKEAGPAEESAPGEAGDVAAPVRVAIVGRPNVGKSSLVNAILGRERVIVTDEPGTTRDAIDVPFERGGTGYVLIDTAGLRRRSRVKESVERYSILRTLRAVDRSDVVCLLLDATQPLAEQDKRIADYVAEAGRAMVLAVNKWDLVAKDEKTYLAYEAGLRRELHYVDWAPVLFISAKTGHNVGRLLQAVRQVADSHRRRVPTAEVTRVFRDAVALNPPPSQGKRRLRVNYITQAGISPPTFVFFVNSPALVTESYQRYLAGHARRAWEFGGTPIRLVFRAKSE